MIDRAGQAHEALRQQTLLEALRGDPYEADISPWMQAASPRWQRGLQAYRANAGALAERALSSAYPTLRQLLGAESFTALARAHWHSHPPGRGDLARWGAALPGFIETDAQLAAEPYLADVARLEWALHQAESAADAEPGLEGIEGLARHDPEITRIVLAPGAALVASAHPIVSIVHAHEHASDDGGDRFACVRQAFAQRRGEHAFVWRRGWSPAACVVSAEHAGFSAALLRREPLARALLSCADGKVFESWLIEALRQGWIAGLGPAARHA